MTGASSPLSAQARVDVEDATRALETRISQLRSLCISRLGQRKFTEVYILLSRKSLTDNAEDDEEALSSILSEHADWRDVARSIAQLIYCEDALSASETQVTFV